MPLVHLCRQHILLHKHANTLFSFLTWHILLLHSYFSCSVLPIFNARGGSLTKAKHVLLTCINRHSSPLPSTSHLSYSVTFGFTEQPFCRFKFRFAFFFLTCLFAAVVLKRRCSKPDRSLKIGRFCVNRFGKAEFGSVRGTVVMLPVNILSGFIQKAVVVKAK